MSIWLNALAGGVQGLGASITARETEERDNRGLALRERYLERRQAIGHDQGVERIELQDTLADENAVASFGRQKELTEIQKQNALERDAARAADDLANTELRQTGAMNRVQEQITAANARQDKDLTQRLTAIQQRITSAATEATNAQAAQKYKKDTDQLTSMMTTAGEFGEEESIDWDLFQTAHDIYMASSDDPNKRKLPSQEPPLSTLEIITARKDLNRRSVQDTADYLRALGFRFRSGAVEGAMRHDSGLGQPR